MERKASSLWSVINKLITYLFLLTIKLGKHINAQVIHLDIFNCESNEKTLLVNQTLNQASNAPPGLKSLLPNSFHINRVPEHLKISVNGSNFYKYYVKFDGEVQIWFLVIRIWIASNDTNIGLDLTPFVNQFRTCVVYQMARYRVQHI